MSVTLCAKIRYKKTFKKNEDLKCNWMECRLKINAFYLYLHFDHVEYHLME